MWNGRSIYVVISRYQKDVSWSEKFRDVDKILIYEKEKPECEYNIPLNKGNEASVYLKYIIDHYDNLPDFTYFIHDDDFSYHHNGSVVDRLYDALACRAAFVSVNNCRLPSLFQNCWLDKLNKWYDEYIEPFIPLASLPSRDWMLGQPASAQFLVHRSIIRNLPLKFYQRLYDWIMSTELESFESGRYLEYSWATFFGTFPSISMRI